MPIFVWNMNDAREIEQIEAHDGGFQTISWSPDSQMVAYRSYENDLVIWYRARYAAADTADD